MSERDVVIRHVPDCKPARAKRILAAWKRERLLLVTEFEGTNRKMRQGLKSDPAKWPGATC